jgi:hypothetical protein
MKQHKPKKEPQEVSLKLFMAKLQLPLFQVITLPPKDKEATLMDKVDFSIVGLCSL